MAREIFPGITVDSQVVHGRPVIAGTRVPVEVVVGELAGGSSFDDIMQDYHLNDEQCAPRWPTRPGCSAPPRSMPQASDAPGWRFLVDENLPARLVGYLRAEGYAAKHAFDVGLRTRPDPTRPDDPDVFAYARTAGATLITQDHDLERDTGQFPSPHPGVVLIELPQE